MSMPVVAPVPVRTCRTREGTMLVNTKSKELSRDTSHLQSQTLSEQARARKVELANMIYRTYDSFTDDSDSPQMA